MRPLAFMPRAIRSGDGSSVRHGTKTGTQPRGANRGRLAGVTRALGVYDRRIAERTRAEWAVEQRLANELAARIEAAQRRDHAREAKQAAQSRESLWFARQIERQRRAQLWQRELAMHVRERRDFALILREELSQQTMSLEELALDRLEDTVVAWLNEQDPSASS